MRKIALSLIAVFAGCVLWASDNLDSDSGAESTRKGAKWPKSGVFSGDKEVDPNF